MSHSTFPIRDLLYALPPEPLNAEPRNPGLFFLATHIINIYNVYYPDNSQ
jgi:hypothetical protein